MSSIEQRIRRAPMQEECDFCGKLGKASQLRSIELVAGFGDAEDLIICRRCTATLHASFNGKPALPLPNSDDLYGPEGPLPYYNQAEIDRGMRKYRARDAVLAAAREWASERVSAGDPEVMIAAAERLVAAVTELRAAETEDLAERAKRRAVEEAKRARSESRVKSA